jgi:hypothetical protein
MEPYRALSDEDLDKVKKLKSDSNIFNENQSIFALAVLAVAAMSGVGYMLLKNKK